MFNGEFPCTGCSLCCLSLSSIHAGALTYPQGSVMYQAAASFPYSWDDTGACIMLSEGKCSVYASRPLLCNVKEISSKLSAELNISPSAVYALTANACNSLISSHGLDPRFMIDPGQFN
jgi:Fe-S-cluster containining protein